MQLGSPSSPDPMLRDIAAAIRDARQVIGHGPAVTVLLPAGRQEQGMASLEQWAAKGAHLLEADLLLQPGDRLALDAPLSWSSAAVCLAAWWAGITVVLVEAGERGHLDDIEVAVVHEDRPVDAHLRCEVLVLGDAIDGAPLGDQAHEPWVRAVQSFPDQPPSPRAAADLPALVANGRTWSQADVLTEARAMPDGTIGVDAGHVAPWLGLIAVAVHPLVSARPTVVLRDVGPGAAAGDRVTQWLKSGVTYPSA